MNRLVFIGYNLSLILGKKRKKRKLKTVRSMEPQLRTKKQIEGPSEEFLARNEKALKNLPTVTDWDNLEKDIS